MKSKTLIALLLLGILCLSYAADSLDSGHGRDLLAKNKKGDKSKSKLTPEEKKAKAEEEREAKALADFEKQQKQKEKERDAILKAAEKAAENVIKEFNKAKDEKQQIEVFVKLWRNADGPTIVFVLKTLISSSASSADYYTGVVAQSMLNAQFKGFSFQVAEGVARALTIVKQPGDGDVLLDAIMVNFEERNDAKKNSGCDYVDNLFTDAETIAIEDGYEIEFSKALENKKYLPLAECFFLECSGVSAECCADEDVVLSGRCDCLKKEPDTCAYNLFLNVPRPIWRCNGEDCEADKCLCPEIKKKAKTGKGKKGKKSKGKKVKKVKKSKKGKGKKTL